MQYGAAINGVRRFANETERGGDRANKAVRKTDASVSLLNRHISGLNGNRFATLSLSALRAANSVDRLRGILLATTTLVGGLGTAFTVRGLQEYSDTWAKVGNRLRIVKTESQALGEVQEKIYDIAQRSRSQFEATGVLFARIAASAKRLNIAQTDTLRVTETIQKAFLVGGSTPTEAAQSSIQLSQGIASNRLQGDELRSVLENPALGQLLADRITAGDIGKLRKLAADGELTAGVIIRAFKDASVEIDRLFSETTQTIGEAFVRIDNAILKSIGQSGKINAGARASVSALNFLADNIDDVIDSVQLLGIAFAAVLGGKAVAGITGFIGQQRALRAEILQSAKAAKDLAVANKAGLAGAAATAKRELIALQKGKAGSLDATRKGFLDENSAASVKAAADAEVAASKSVVDATQARIQSTRQSAEATAKATAARREFIAVARNEKAALVNAVEAAKAQRTLATSQLFAAKSAQELAQTTDINARALASYDKKVAVATANSVKATESLQLAEQRLSAHIAGNLAHTKEYAAAKAASTKATAAATAATAKASAARAAETAAIAKLTAAQTTLATAQRNNNLTEAQRAALSKQSVALEGQIEAAKKRSAAASATLAAANKRAAIATAELNSVMAAQTVRATAAGVAMRGLSATVGFLGGPAGVALLALGAAFFFLSNKAAEAEALTARYEGAVKKAGESSDGASVSIREAGRALQFVADAATAAERAVALAGATDDLSASFERLRALASQANADLKDFSGQTFRDISGLIDQFQKGEISAEDFVAAVDKISEANPDVSATIAKIIAIARTAGAAQGAVDALSESMRNLGAIGKGARPGSIEDKRIPVPDDIGMRIKDDLKEQKNDLLKAANEAGTLDEATRRLYGLDPDAFGSKRKKGRAPSKTIDDRFANALQEVQNRTEALRQEREAINLTYAAQIERTERLKVEQDALKQVREEARKKGDADWQNAQLTGEQVAQIDQKIAAYVREKMALKQVVESQEAWMEASGEAGGIIKGLIDGSKDWKDALLDLIPVFIKLANNMNIAGGGKGIFGGGVLQSFVGGLLGISFHSGGTVGRGGNVVSFPTGAPYAGKFHGGGNFGGNRAKHDEVMALVKEKENIFTESQTNGIIGALQSGMPRDGGRMSLQPHVEQHFHIDGAISSADVANMVRQGAAEAVDTVKRSLDNWSGELSRDGSFA